MAKRKKIIIITSIIAAVLLIDLTVTGFLRFGYNVARCGKLPVKATTTTFGGGYTWYDLPGQYTPGGVSGVKYYCSEAEVIQNRIPKGM